MKRFAILALLVGLVALPLFAQTNPTGTLTGHVTDGKEALPGVTVSATSPNLQGTRTTVTNVSGDYILTFLPAGEYKIRFELQGFQTLDTSIKISAAQSSKLDATMPTAKVAEEVTVTGSYDTISATGTAATTFTKEMVYKLPVAKDIANIALLTAGVVANPGAQGALIISGAPSYENQFLVNGVAIMDNVRGTPTAGLYIEDAVQETTTTTSGISAEYGRFTGGVVNMLTKSGGNEFHASVRDTMTADSWTAESPLSKTDTRSSTVNSAYEATLGGFIVKDHLWFFGAYRTVKTNLTGQLGITQITVPTGNEQQRYEGKLTFAINPNHRIVASYLDTKNTDLGYWFLVSNYTAMDKASVYDRQTPRTLEAFNYTGVLTDNFFIEAQYSKKTFKFENSGSRYTDLGRGTWFLDTNNFYPYEAYNSPIFCAVCKNSTELRDNDDYLAKASWFLSSEGLGSHDIVLGADRFEDKRLSNNYQSGSGYYILPDGEVGWTEVGIPGPGILDPNGSPYPVMIGNSGSSYIGYTPISLITNGNNFRTDSLFLNDKWRLNNSWSFNIGVRYDKNHGENGVGQVVTDDQKISPRLGVTFDPTGDSKWVFNASYATYVAAIAGSVADISAGGTPASLTYLYTGPDFNTNCNPNAPTAATCTPARDVATGVLTWFQGLSQADQNALLVFASVPGYNTLVPKSLKSPNAREISIGANTRLGTKGSLRIDYVNRKYENFYSNVVNTTTGKSQPDPYGNVYDMLWLENTDSLRRQYEGVNVSLEYRVLDTLNLGGNYTYSTLWGNFAGETGGSGPGAAGTETYPEYKAFSQYNPDGYLQADQRHRARVFAVWDILNTKHNRLSLSVMESYASGTPYQAVGSITIRPYVATNLGYLSPPSSVNYYFSRRGAFRFDDITRTDLGFNSAFVIPALGSELQFFVEPRVTNLLNEHGQVGGNTSVYTSRNAGKGLSAFNPFTDKPIECPQGADAATCTSLGANWQKGPNFGKALTPTTASNALGDLQMPRTYTLSFGVRF